MIYSDDNIHDVFEKIAFLGSASKPLHEMSNKEIKRHRRNWEEERKTPETKIVRGLSYGIAGAAGFHGVGRAAVAASPVRRLAANKIRLADARDNHKHFGSKFLDPQGKKLRKVKDLEEVVAALAKKVNQNPGIRPRARQLGGGAAGAIAGAGALYGLTQLGDYLGRRRLGREDKRRGIPEGSWKKASVNSTWEIYSDDTLHEALEKVAARSLLGGVITKPKHRNVARVAGAALGGAVGYHFGRKMSRRLVQKQRLAAMRRAWLSRK